MLCILIKELQKLQTFQLSVILSNKTRLASELQNLGVAVYIIDEKKYGHFKSLMMIRNMVFSLSPDIIHSHGIKEGLLSLIAVIGRRIKLITTQA